MEVSYKLQCRLYNGDAWTDTIAPDHQGEWEKRVYGEVGFRNSVEKWQFLAHRLIKCVEGEPSTIVALYDLSVDSEV